ncbi:MAG: hypothetical protein ACAI35_21585 [Candidatus Methylacidiphilales bacterium]|nr:hypothetical protein [Candidatus Methylacidiphilales bacterium]
MNAASTPPTSPVEDLELTALNGANPLGFLAALGTLLTLHKAGHSGVRLGWKLQSHWTPVIRGVNTYDKAVLTASIANCLRGNTVSADAGDLRDAAQKKFDAAKKKVTNKVKEIKDRKLSRAEKKEADMLELAPLQATMTELRTASLQALKLAVPRKELAVGKTINCTREDYRELAADSIACAALEDREFADYLAAFGSDGAVFTNSETIMPTPFCFISGAGHQYFLESARELTEKATSVTVDEAIFGPWPYHDEKYSLRWDPGEDVRYALLAENPSTVAPLGTVWMANLLAYCALPLFASAPGCGGYLETTAWHRKNRQVTFTWPLWEHPLLPDAIRSLLQYRALHELKHPERKARGVTAVFTSERIQVGKYFNFTPAAYSL